jgi:phage baseplate assembly protein W
MTVTTPPGDDSAVIRRRLLGVGLRADLVSPADTARDVGLRRTAAGVDLDVVEGIDALGQDLAVELTTLRGTDFCNASFGFTGLEPLATQTSPVLAREAMRAAVAALVAADPRVRQVTDVSVDVPGDAPGSRQLTISVAFEAISGDPTTVAAGGMASGAPFGELAHG